MIEIHRTERPCADTKVGRSRHWCPMRLLGDGPLWTQSGNVVLLLLFRIWRRMALWINKRGHVYRCALFRKYREGQVHNDYSSNGEILTSIPLKAGVGSWGFLAVSTYMQIRKNQIQALTNHSTCIFR